jgi:hypothetical protein
VARVLCWPWLIFSLCACLAIQWDAETDGSGGTGAAGLLSQSHGQSYSFTLQLDSAEVQGNKKSGSGGGEKDVILRVDGVDALIKWMNAIGSVRFILQSDHANIGLIDWWVVLAGG